MRCLNIFIFLLASLVLCCCQQNAARYSYSTQKARSAWNQPATTRHYQAAVPRQARQTAPPGSAGMGAARPAYRPSTPAPRPTGAAAVCVIDPRTGTVLYEHNARTRRQVASTQKIITALCVCDAGGLDRMVTINREDVKAPPIKLNLTPGTSYRKMDLLRAMMTGSFNDLAMTLARDTAGSVPAFVNRMNAKARQMKMYNSHFENPSGLPANQYSTAYDMARAACYAYYNPIIRSLINIPEYTFTRTNGTTRRIRSTNKLLGRYPWVQGMKTGYTNAAGKCLISCGSLNGRSVIVVILGSSNAKIWDESLRYLRWALDIA